ncbi:MAG TPA: hypothetical protein PKH68_01335 [Paludibacteraceae bacterium]|nr:hypothetical protein [Paludibacteraceae bacterium]
MSPFEIVSTIVAILGLAVLILKVWIKSQTDIAAIKVEINATNNRQKNMENDLKQHKLDDNFRYEQMRKENREDHGKLFEKIDKIIEKQDDNRRAHSNN